MDISMAEKAIDYIFTHSVEGEEINIGFFGGEPLLVFERLQEITFLIERHSYFSKRKVDLQVTTNGTIFNDDIAGFLSDHKIGLGISCDGTSSVQNLFRKFKNGKPSSYVVENNMIKAVKKFPGLMVNMVFTPLTYRSLPESLDYLYSLGIRRIFVNPDFSASWDISDSFGINEVYNEIGQKYVMWYKQSDPSFVSIIDGKMIVILNNGYRSEEKCHMGKKEFAISPNGNIFPCERLVGDGSENPHCIGNIVKGIDYSSFCNSKNFSKSNFSVCHDCALRNFCMNWCGCSNYFSSGSYSQVGPFICASEKAAIRTAFEVFQELEALYGASVIQRIVGVKCNPHLFVVDQENINP